ncbi:MAG: hypothetical protein IJD91_08020 [Clostridia bacterium]|nr:hypothetical protein [Clostridia bacterium]
MSKEKKEMLETLLIDIALYRQLRATHTEDLDDKIERLIEVLKWMD